MSRNLACGCVVVFITDASKVVDFEAVVNQGCRCCGAGERKKCIGAGAGRFEANQKRPAFAFADVCPARLEVQQSLDA